VIGEQDAPVPNPLLQGPAFAQQPIETSNAVQVVPVGAAVVVVVGGGAAVVVVVGGGAAVVVVVGGGAAVVVVVGGGAGVVVVVVVVVVVGGINGLCIIPSKLTSIRLPNLPLEGMY
jgi:hypothetical protein